jgi:hypothetical protein
VWRRAAVPLPRYCGLLPTIMIICGSVWGGGGPTVAQSGRWSRDWYLPAAIPCSFKVATKRFAACSRVSAAPRIVLTSTPFTYVGPSTVHGPGPASQCAFCKIVCNTCAKGVVSGLPGKIYMCATVPWSGSSLPLIARCSSSVSVLGASLASSCTLAKRSCSAILFASAARSYAEAISALALSASTESRAVSLFNSAIRSFDFAKSALARSRNKSQWCSFTIPIHTIATVAAAPITSEAIKRKLARSNIQLAHSSEGHGWFPAWIPISAIIAITIIGLSGLAAIFDAIRRRR